VAELEAELAVVARLLTGDGSIVLTVMLSSQPGPRTSVAFFSSACAVTRKRA
jgi:hypothetical protein